MAILLGRSARFFSSRAARASSFSGAALPGLHEVGDGRLGEGPDQSSAPVASRYRSVLPGSRADDRSTPSLASRAPAGLCYTACPGGHNRGVGRVLAVRRQVVADLLHRPRLRRVPQRLHDLRPPSVPSIFSRPCSSGRKTGRRGSCSLAIYHLCLPRRRAQRRSSQRPPTTYNSKLMPLLSRTNHGPESSPGPDFLARSPAQVKPQRRAERPITRNHEP